MPLTEMVLIATGFIVYILGVCLWICRCFNRMDTNHPWLDQMPVWQRVAYDPTLVFVASLPVLGILVLLVFRAAMVS